MHYHRYIDTDVINGPGTRCTLFVSGCEHQCPGCYNASTWRANSGHPATPALTQRIINDLQDRRIHRRGLSLSGGDPLYPPNCHDILQLVQQIKHACPDKDIWLWTGYQLETLRPEQRRILDHIDTLIDGPFIQTLADPTLHFRGSSNQRILTPVDWSRTKTPPQQIAIAQ